MKALTQWIATALLVFGFSLSNQAAITGQWGFADGDIFLSPVIGLPMDFLDSDTSFDTEFGTTGTGNFVGVPHINGQPAKPLKYPATSLTGGYIVPHGAAPNGGGSLINQYTIIMDVLFPAASSGRRRALIQTDGGGNAEFFIDANNRIGTDGGLFHGNVTPDTWHRIAIAVDLAATPPVIAKFIDGVNVGQENPSGGIDGRFAMNVFYLFNDDDGETVVCYLNSLQFRDEKAADGLIMSLGAPTASGILTGPPPNPYVTFLAPSPESARIPERSDVGPRPLVQAIIVDGTNAVNESMVTLLLDNVPVAVMVSKMGETTTVSYLPPALLPPRSLHTVRVNYPGQDGTPYSAQWQFFVATYIGLPADGAAPLGSANTPGFLVRTVQAPIDAVIPNVNTFNRAIRQLNGTLTDTGSVLVANVAVPGPNANGSYNADVINYHLEAGTAYGAFGDDLAFPGIPGGGAGNDVFATEVLSYLELTAGAHRLGVSVSVDRTDTGTDDGFRLFGGRDPRNILAPELGRFARTVLNDFANLPNFNEFTVVAPTNGVYCVRLVHFQTLQDASLEFYSVEPGTTNRILINSGDPQALKAYRFSTASFANRPYLAEISPAPGGVGVSPLLPVEVLIIDDQTQVDTSSVQLFLNGTSVPRTVNKSGNRTTVFYQPNATRTELTNRWRLLYSDNAAPTPNSFTNEWDFITSPPPPPSPPVTGQWDFDCGDLSATIGQPLEYFDGANGQTAGGTQFGSTTSFGIPDINGRPAGVMRVPGTLNNQIGYIMRHGIPANGGGTRVNQYTLIYDIYWESVPPGFASFINFDLSNSSDGDFFFRVGDGGFGQGGGGYEGNARMMIGQWHRVAFAVDMAADPPVVTKFLDGFKHADQLMPNNQLDGDRRAMLVNGAVLFGDNGDERGVCYVNSIQVRDGKLSDAQIAALGGPGASGIPVIAPRSTVKGQWDFETGTLAPTVGQALEYFDGPDGQTAGGTQFGTTSDFGISDINGQPARVMCVPGTLNNQIGYIMRHGIAANGGGSRVNQYTLIYDLYWSSVPPGFASFINFDLSNQSDGDFFFRVGDGGFGQGGGGYEGSTRMMIGQWHRVVFAVDMAASPPVVTKFLDGLKHADQLMPNNQLDGDRRAMLVNGAVLFGDNGDERGVGYVSSIQVREGKLSDAEIAALGGPSASGIPIATPQTTVTGQWDFNRQDLAPTIGRALEYFDGPGGQTANGTQFGTTTSFSIPDINGQPADVMCVPGTLNNQIGYVMRHGIAANGGGSRVNQYTLVYDIYWSSVPPGFASFINFDLSNQSDGDFFFRVGDGGFGQGGGGYEGNTRMMIGQWHRVAFAVDMAASPPVVTKFLDGVKHADQLMPNNQLDGDRRSMLVDGAVLFGDNGDERGVCYVNSIQVREGKLSDAELAALGGPSADGVPAVVPADQIEARISYRREGNNLRLLWPATLSGYALESTPTLTNPNWQQVADVTANCANIPIAASMRFFRLRK